VNSEYTMKLAEVERIATEFLAAKSPTTAVVVEIRRHGDEQGFLVFYQSEAGLRGDVKLQLVGNVPLHVRLDGSVDFDKHWSPYPRRRGKEIPALPLTSDRWQTLRTTTGSGTIAAELLSRIQTDPGSLDALYGELHEQLCHQLTLVDAAYAAVPHVVNLATAETGQRAALRIVGEVAALCSLPKDSDLPPPPAIPEDLERPLIEAFTAARRLVGEILRSMRGPAGDARDLIAVMSALQGQPDLAIHLFLAEGQLSCPHCGEGIRW
jgi:hypothetical protein